MLKQCYVLQNGRFVIVTTTHKVDIGHRQRPYTRVYRLTITLPFFFVECNEQQQQLKKGIKQTYSPRFEEEKFIKLKTDG